MSNASSKLLMFVCKVEILNLNAKEIKEAKDAGKVQKAIVKTFISHLGIIIGMHLGKILEI